MKTKTVLFSLLLASLSLGACDKGDKKSEKKTDESAKAGEGKGEGKGDKDKDKRQEAPADDKLGASKDGDGDPAVADPAQPDGNKAAPDGAGATAPVSGKGSVPSASGPIEILSEGAEPKFALTYQAAAGTKQNMEMSMDIIMDIPQMGKMTMPTMIMLADVEVMSVDGDGSMTSKMVFTGAEVRDTKDSMPGAADAMKGQLDGIKGMTTTMTIDPHGKVLKMDVDTSTMDPALKQAMGQTKQSLDQMVAPLPVQAVGKGAKWRVTQTVDQGGMKVDQTIVFELVEVSEGKARIKGVATLSAPKQEIDQGGMKVSLESLTGNAVTEMDIDFSKVVPTVTGTVDMKMKMKAMGQSADMAMTMKMGMRAK